MYVYQPAKAHRDSGSPVLVNLDHVTHITLFDRETAHFISLHLTSGEREILTYDSLEEMTVAYQTLLNHFLIKILPL